MSTDGCVLRRDDEESGYGPNGGSTEGVEILKVVETTAEDVGRDSRGSERTGGKKGQEGTGDIESQVRQWS